MFFKVCVNAGVTAGVFCSYPNNRTISHGKVDVINIDTILDILHRVNHLNTDAGKQVIEDYQHKPNETRFGCDAWISYKNRRNVDLTQGITLVFSYD